MGDLAVFGSLITAAAVAEGEGLVCGDLDDIAIRRRGDVVAVEAEGEVCTDQDRRVKIEVIAQIHILGKMIADRVIATALRGNVTITASQLFFACDACFAGQRAEGQIGVRTVRAVRADANRMLMWLTEVQLKMIALKLDAVFITGIIVNEESSSIVLGRCVALAVGKGDRARCGHAFQRNADLLLPRGEAAGDLDGFTAGDIDVVGVILIAESIALNRHIACNFECAIHVEHAAALARRIFEFVIDDLSSTGSVRLPHTEGAVQQIDAGAGCGRVALIGHLAADRAAGHDKRAIADIHAAAILGGRVAVDVAVVHGKAFC